MKPLILLGLFMMIASGANAQFSLKTEYIGMSAYRDDDTEEKVGNYKGAAITYQANLNIPLSAKINENGLPSTWGINMGAVYADLNNKNFKENLVSDEIFDVYLGVSNTIPISKKWFMANSIGVGIYSPTKKLSHITKKHILGNVSSVFVCNVRPNLQLGAGLAFNNTFGYPMAFPALYLNWNTDGALSININMTDGFISSCEYDFSEKFSLSAIWEVTGQMSFEEKDGKDMMFSHQYMVAGIRPEFKLGKNISIPLTFGVNTMRMVGYDKRTLKAMFVSTGSSGYFGVSPYMAAELSIKF